MTNVGGGEAGPEETWDTYNVVNLFVATNSMK